MKTIFVRSPYSIVINNSSQIETKLELYLWNKPNVSPATPTYTFSALIPSTTQRTAYYNIASECQEFIDNINPNYVDGLQTEKNNMFAYAKAVASYRTPLNPQITTTSDSTTVKADNVNSLITADQGNPWEVLSNETFICLYGYSEYSQGVNYNLNQNVVMLNSGSQFGSTQTIPINNYAPLFRVDSTTTTVDSTMFTADKYYIAVDYSTVYDPYLNALIQPDGATYSIAYENSIKSISTNLVTNGTETLVKIPLESQGYTYGNPYLLSLKRNGAAIFSRTIIPTCETKYTPMLLSFINKLGGWENLWLMKLSENTITAKGTDYSLSPETFNYNIYKGQSKSFNRNGKKVIKANTGWVDENTNEVLTELMMSETIILNNQPVLLKTESQVLKQYVKEKNINYALEFELKSNLINTVV